jgi:hypothetical protein
VAVFGDLLLWGRSVAFVPTLFFLGARSFVAPVGFLQNFFVFGVGSYFLGAAQIVAFFGLCVILGIIWRN